MRIAPLALVLAVGCGRIDFDPVVGEFAPTHETYFKASNTGSSDELGWSVAISGDGQTLALGARTEASNARGIDGDQTDNNGPQSGAVYVFRKSGATWAQEAYIKSSNADPNDQFGWSVALSGDGSTLAVGARFEDSGATGVDGDQANNAVMDAGAIYTFVRTGATWTQQAYLKSTGPGINDELGFSVALSDDGDTVAGGTFNDAGIGAVFVYRRAGSTWSLEAKLVSGNGDPDDQFGTSCALARDGNTIVVGALLEDGSAGGDPSDNSVADSGAAYVFTRSGGTWTQVAYLKASNAQAADRFGEAVAIDPDGQSVAIGARGEDGAGAGVDGDPNDNGALDSGAAYVFTRSGVGWMQAAYVKSTIPKAGASFGFSVAIAAGTLAVSATGGNGLVDIFQRSGLRWTATSPIAARDGGPDLFGVALGFSSDASALIVGAPGEDSKATGVDGDRLDNSVPDSGAAYLYD